MLIIFMISSMTGTTINEKGLDNELLQINGHFVLFFLLCLAFFKATKNIALSIFLSALYALFDEFHQIYTLLRSPSFFDIKVDTLGAVFAGLILWKLQHLLPKKLKSWLNN